MALVDLPMAEARVAQSRVDALFLSPSDTTTDLPRERDSDSALSQSTVAIERLGGLARSVSTPHL